MKTPRYRNIKRVLKNVCFAPDPESERRLLEALGVRDGRGPQERRFLWGFRIAAAAAVAVACLPNLRDAKPEALYQRNGAIVMAIAQEVGTSPLWSRLTAEIKE